MDGIVRLQTSTSKEGEESAPLSSIAEVLRLIGTGAGGPILMTLGQGSLRTRELTERLNHLSPRSVYRYLNNMRDLGLIARREETGVPSRVMLSLTDPLGRNLFDLLNSFVLTTMSRFPRRGDGSEPWGSVALLGDLWELGFVEELSHGPRSVTQFARRAHPLTYHQVNRRAGLAEAGSLIRLCGSNGNGKHYELTDHCRRCMGLISGIARWRQRHLAEDDARGLPQEEMATVLRASLPLLHLPEFSGMKIGLEVSEGAGGKAPGGAYRLQGEVGEDGTPCCDPHASEPADGSAAATVNTWFGVLLEGNRGRVKVRGDQSLVDACLTQLHGVLWEQPATDAMLASSQAGGD